MRVKIGWFAGICILALGLASSAAAQGPPRRAPRPTRVSRPAARLWPMPRTIARGEQIYTANCRFCHGADLRGGDSGGPNLLRSRLVFNDQEGELVGPIVLQGSNRPGGGMMPPIPMPPDDIKAIAAYLHSVQASMQRPRQSAARRSEGAERARRRRERRQGLLQLDLQVVPLRRRHEGARGRSSPRRWTCRTTGCAAAATAAPPESPRRRRRVTVKTKAGETHEGELVRYDDFIVLAARGRRRISLASRAPRTGRTCKSTIRGRPTWTCLPKYTDKNIHDVTAYLASLK